MVFPAVLSSPARASSALAAFNDPTSVAVVGASPNPAKWGHWLAKGALRGRGRRQVYLINRSESNIAGIHSFRSLRDLPQVPDLVAIAVPGSQVLTVIREALQLGCRAFLVVAAHVNDEQEIVELLAAYGARMIGPNSLGIFSAKTELQLMWGDMSPGSLAIVSQSGQLGSEIAAIGRRKGVGISRFVSFGNQADVRAAEIIESIIGDGQTKTLGVYIEDFSGADELFALMREATDQGLSVVLLTTGESAASRQLAQSHTGAMTSSTDLVDAACRTAGALRVHTPAELVQIASYLDRRSAPAGPRIAVISDSGGQGGVAADVAARFGLDLPELSAPLRARLQLLLPQAASTRNPIDLAGAGEANLGIYAELPRLLAESGEIDAVVLSGYFCSYGHDTPQLRSVEQDVATRLSEIVGLPVLVHAIAPGSDVSQQLRDAGVPVSGRIEDTLFSLASAHRLEAARRLSARVQPDISVAEPLTGTDLSKIRDALERGGIEFPERRIVRSSDEAAQAAAEIGGTLVVKADWLPHKTESGGVRLNLANATATAEAFREMHARLGDGDYTVEAQDTREHIAEFIVAARNDPDFGAIVTVGHGGTETEVWSDVVLELAPVGVSAAHEMVRRLRSARLLEPWRGRPALASEGLARVIVTLGTFLATHPGIREIELNPVRVGVDRAVAVDCLTILDETPRLDVRTPRQHARADARTHPKGTT